MSSTNKTPNLNLSQFIASDVPAWLVDYNGDMSKIDAGVGAVKTEVDEAVAKADQSVEAVSGVSNTVAVHTGQINTMGTQINTVSGKVDQNSSAITQINSDLSTRTVTLSLPDYGLENRFMVSGKTVVMQPTGNITNIPAGGFTTIGNVPSNVPLPPHTVRAIFYHASSSVELSIGVSPSGEIQVYNYGSAITNATTFQFQLVWNGI